jgi:hypothetical protein
VSNDDFRRDLNRVFDDVSGSPSANLRDRVRSAVTEAPSAREPYWIAGVAAALIAVIIVGVLFVANPLKRVPSPIGGINPTPTTSATTSPSAQPSPSSSPSASAQPFDCTSQSLVPSSQQQPLYAISALRTGTHTSYDRLTIEIAVVPVEVSIQSGTTFTLSPSGMQTTLKGKNGILVTIHNADLHSSYSGPIDIVTGYSGLAEVRRVQDFEGTVQLGLGVNGPACYRVFWLTNPSRLVIDVQNS